MLVPTMDIYSLMVHDNQIEEQNFKQVGGQLKKTKNLKLKIFSETRFEVQDKPRFKSKFSNQVPSNTPRVNKG